MLTELQLKQKWNLKEALEAKQHAAELSKASKQVLDAMKEDMLENDVMTLEDNGVRAVVSKTEKVDMDEEMLTQMLIELAERGDQIAKSCLKTVTVLDVDKVEEAVYHKRLDPTIITKATTCKTVTQLRITKLKAKK